MEKLFIANLNYDTTTEDLWKYVADHGFEVTDAKVITDRMTGKSRGFGFVELKYEDQLSAAIAALDQKPFEGRKLTVKIAQPIEKPARQDRERRQPRW